MTSVSPGQDHHARTPRQRHRGPIGCEGKIHEPDGKSEEAGLKADQATWSPAGRHSGENLEKTPAQVVLVELKGTKAPTATIPTNRADMKIIPLFDNSRAIAYKATTGPSFHEPAGSTHDFDQVVIALGQ